MKLTLAHERPTLHSTPGRLMCDDGWCCFTMEIGQPIRHGRYSVVTAFSAALMKMLLAFRNDDGRIVGFIHSGSAGDVHAPMHVLIGMDRAVDLVVNSKRAYRELEKKVEEAEAMFGESITIEIQPFYEPTHAPG